MKLPKSFKIEKISDKFLQGSNPLDKKKEDFVIALVRISSRWSNEIRKAINLNKQNEEAKDVVERYLWYLGLFFIQNAVLSTLKRPQAEEILDRLYYHCFKIMEKIGLGNLEVSEEENVIKNYFLTFKDYMKMEKTPNFNFFDHKLLDDLYSFLKLDKDNDKERFSPDVEMKIITYFYAGKWALQEIAVEGCKEI